MMDVEDISKLIGLILSLIGGIAFIIGIMSMLSTEPNPMLVVGGAVSLGIGVLIFRIFG